MPPARRTRLILAVSLVALAVYDLGVFAVYGGPASISTAIGQWIAGYWWFAVVFGAVFGHLTAMMPTGTTDEPWRWLVVFAAFAASATVTKWVG